MPKDRDYDDDDDDDRPRKRRQSSSDGDGVAGVIPYRNMMALLSYYFGIFGLLLCFLLGVPGLLGIIPLIMGILGFMKAQKDPEARGSAHAIVGIICGLIEVLTGCSALAYFMYAGLSGHK